MNRTCYYDKTGKSIITDDGQPEGYHYDFRGNDLREEPPEIAETNEPTALSNEGIAQKAEVQDEAEIEPKKRGRPKKK